MGLSIVQKLDGILEYCQTSSSDLTLPDLKDDEKPSSYARKDLIEVEQKIKELLEAAEYVIMKNDEIEMTGFRELLEAVNKAKGDNDA